MGKDVVTYDEQWAAQAQSYADKEKAGGNFISTRGGILKLGDDEFEGNQMCVIILDSIFENTMYADDFDEENITSPVCYAMAHDEDEMAPHVSMQKSPEYFAPQAEDCASCPLNEWGSADKGKGKACANRRRLAVIPAGFYSKIKGTRGEYELEVFDEEEHYKTADMFFLKLPVTSGREYSKFVKAVSGEFNRPPYGVLARISAEPDKNSNFKIHFEALETLPDEMFPVIHARHEEAAREIITPYSPPDEDDEKPARSKGRLAGLRS